MLSAPLQADLVVRLHLVECALRALVSTHPEPEKISEALSRELGNALKTDASAWATTLRDRFARGILTTAGVTQNESPLPHFRSSE